MTHQEGHVSEHELHAYLDGELDPARRQAVEQHLATNAEDADRLRAWKAQKAALHALFDPVLHEEIPTHIHRGSTGAGPGWLAQAAAALIFLGLGGAIGYALGGAGWAPGAPERAAGAPLARQAATAHAVYTPEVLHPVEVPAEQQAHLVKWLSKRLGQPLDAPDLSAHGFALIGGRLLSADNGPAAQFMYEAASGERLTLFVRRDLADNRDSAFQFSHQDGISVFHWVDRNLGYALSGPLSREPLLAVATTVYAQLNP